MHKIKLMTAIAALAVSAGAFAQSGPQRGPQADVTRAQAAAHADAQFGRMDLNRDGQLTREEIQQAMQQRMAQRMSQLTPEKRAQMEQRRAQRGDKSAKGAKGAGRGGRGGSWGNIQGPISLAQFREQALQRFDRLDTDRNGIISAAEVQQARAQRVQRQMQTDSAE